MKRCLIILATVLTVVPTLLTNAFPQEILAGSEWGPGYPDRQFVRFEGEGRVSGTGGCNRIFGTYEASIDGSIRIGPLAATKMACPGEVMEKENAFVKNLESTRRYERESGRLLLFDGKGNELLALRHLDWD